MAFGMIALSVSAVSPSPVWMAQVFMAFQSFGCLSALSSSCP